MSLTAPPLFEYGEDFEYLQHVITDPGYADGVAEASRINIQRSIERPVDPHAGIVKHLRRVIVAERCQAIYLEGDIEIEPDTHPSLLTRAVMSDPESRARVFDGFAEELARRREQVALDRVVAERYQGNLELFHQEIESRTEEMRQVARDLPEELEAYPKAIVEIALERWGRSRDLWENDNNGIGFNAGVVHYFLYRLAHEKSRRWHSLTPLAIAPTVDAFVRFSEDIYSFVQQEPGSKPLAYAKLEDEYGNTRTHTLGLYNGKIVKIVANDRAELGSGLQIVTVLPWGRHTRQSFERNITSAVENSEREQARLNRFSGRVTVEKFFWSASVHLNQRNGQRTDDNETQTLPRTVSRLPNGLGADAGY